MKTIRYSLFILFLTGLLALNSCSEDNPANPTIDPSDSSSTVFSRDSMLLDIANGIVVPAFSRLAAEAQTLNAAIEAFTSQPSEATLESLQTTWKATYEAWQNANAFNFGPASFPLGELDILIGIFPVDVQQIEAYITAGDTGLDNINNDTRGFLAMEYLIFGKLTENNAEVVALFANNAENRKAYLKALGNHALSLLETVNSEWPTYRDQTFLVQNGADAGSSITLYYNEFIRSFEKLKNFKMRLPSGNYELNAAPLPDQVENLYSGLSVPMMKLHLAALERIWRGETTNGTELKGFRAYALSKAGGQALVDATEAQLAATWSALNAIPEGKLSDLVAAETAEVDTAYLELQKLTRYWKSDLYSLLGISLTFQSGDGD